MVFKAEIIFVRIIFPFIIGIVSAYYFQYKELLQWTKMILFGTLVLIVFCNIFYKQLKAWKYKKAISLLHYLCFFLFGAFLCLLNTHFLQPRYFAEKEYQQLKVWVANEPQQTNDILRFEANVTQGYINQQPSSCQGKLLVALKLDSLNPIRLSYGDELLINTHYQPVEPPYNPAEFNFKAWLASKNIYHQTFIRQEQLAKLPSSKGNPLIKYALDVRKKQVDIYRELIQDDEAFAVASTLILGYRSDLSKETLAAYSKTGTIHALSVSGMHVGIIYLMLHWLLSFMDKRKWSGILKLILICTLIWYYSLLTGFSPSVLRSAVMLSVFILSKQLKRKSNGYNTLAFTAFCLLVIDPFLIWDVGFQLSFLAVFGLIYFQPLIYKWWYIENKWLDKVWATIALSLAAQLATLPLSIYYFHQFPIYFIISNLFILLPIAVLMYVGIAILLLKAYFLAPAFEWLIVFTNNGLKWIADLPYSGITEIWLTKSQLWLLTLLIVLITIGLACYKKRHIVMAGVVLLLLQVSFSYQKVMAQNQKEIVFFSLRKNYAAAFIDGNNSIILTDLSPDDKNFEFFVQPTLHQKRISHIHFVKWNEDYIGKNFVKRHRQILFKNKKILLMDESFDNKKLTEKPNFDLVWLHNNPKQQLPQLTQEISFKHMVIDASNKDYIISKFEQQAKNLDIATNVLKKNKAITVNLKQ